MMPAISISEELRGKVPGIRLLCLECDVVTGDSPEGLLALMDEQCLALRGTLKTEEISTLPAIRASRAAYRRVGKDPARYRLSAEALLRRVVRGEALYRISNVVDLLNLVSITSGFSIGGYDAAALGGEVEFGIGRAGEPYQAIGRGEFNIEGLPVFRDRRGPFGSPTSDSERTRVTPSTRRFLMVFIDFGSSADLEAAGQQAVNWLKAFAGTQNVEIQLVD
jgi:DNA/RNA-binding domain of Phe-tRNA-synthetase-like protein